MSASLLDRSARALATSALARVRLSPQRWSQAPRGALGEDHRMRRGKIGGERFRTVGHNPMESHPSIAASRIITPSRSDASSPADGASRSPTTDNQAAPVRWSPFVGHAWPQEPAALQPLAEQTGALAVIARSPSTDRRVGPGSRTDGRSADHGSAPPAPGALAKPFLMSVWHVASHTCTPVGNGIIGLVHPTTQPPPPSTSRDRPRP